MGYRFGDRAVLASSFARPVTADDASPQVKRLMNVVTEMAIASGLPMPRVHLIDDPDPNAFATGRGPDHASIAVTTGLLAAMGRDELQGVVAHEMAHVRNYDIRKMTIVAALLGALLLLSDWGTRFRLGVPSSGNSGRKRREGGTAAGPLALVLLGLWLLTVLLAPLIGRLLATAVSRRREYLADASGAELTRNPLGLASALRKLEAAGAPTVRIHRGTAHLCIADPLGRAVNERDGWLADLLGTHPPIADRIARLEAMGYRARARASSRRARPTWAPRLGRWRRDPLRPRETSVKVDMTLAIDDLRDVPAIAREAEALGFDGLWTAETRHDPFLPLALGRGAHPPREPRHGDRGRLSPEPHRGRAHRLGPPGRLGRALDPRARHPGEGAHRAAVLGQVDGPGAAAPRVHPGAAGDLGRWQTRDP